MTGYGDLSLWLDDIRDDLQPREPLAGDSEVDVAIVGAGYTGLWTAYYLAERAPDARVLVIEAETAGFGASGRNGGWVVGEMAASFDALERAGGREGAVRQVRAAMGAVDEVGRVIAAEDIACDFQKGGTVRLARNQPQLDRMSAEVEHLHGVGFDDEDLRMLSADEATDQLAATDVLGGLAWQATAAVHPARLVRGLAEAVERRGVVIVEQTRARSIERGQVSTDRGTIRADVVVRALEGYTGSLPGQTRRLAPLYSLMVATEPLDDDTWDSIGLRDRQTFADDRHLVIYGQRTATGRIAFGGRGAPYGFGSKVSPEIERRSGMHDLIHQTLVELLPQVAGAEITHRWGGVLGVPRDWFPSVGLDRERQLAWGGGYVGEGVAISNLAGRTLADLISNTRSDLVTLPWVGHRSRRWEPEPLRWMGINGGLKLMEKADQAEDESGASSWQSKVMEWLLS